MTEAPENVQRKLENLPKKPGVYLMHNVKGEVIYVGKGVNLANRVRSYFHASAQVHPKTRRLVSEIADLEWIITDSEIEALILEANLIKRHRPRYNVRLKDDKRYPYLKVTGEAFPKVVITRRMKRDGGQYFGPYTSTRALRETLDLLRRLFPYRTCDRTITGEDRRACLYHDLQLCTAPCIGAVDEEEYNETIDQLLRFMNGETEDVMVDLQAGIEKAAANLQFERAAQLRDRFEGLQHVMKRQRIISTAATNQDVVALACDDGNACVEVFFVRNGKLLGREQAALFGRKHKAVTEIVDSAHNTGASIAGPIPLPTKIQRFTVNRSVHVNKKSREQFELRVHKRLLDLLEPTQQTVDALGKLSLPAGVDVEIKL